MRAYILIPIFFLSIIVNGQVPTNIDRDNFNFKYLEHLVKIGVDEVRNTHNLKPLVNDSILYLAANHHANYLVDLGRLSHSEDDSILTKTPQARAEYFGAKNYRVGENILFTPINRSVKDKSGEIFDTHTYQGLADAMVSGWVNSPGHFKNIITADYELTGLSIALDSVTGRAFACQKFAIADYQYAFTENKVMFPFSNYVPPILAKSFTGIDNQLIKNYEYPFKLKHDKPQDCAECDELTQITPYLTLRIERNKFILRVENSNYVKNLMDKRLDGFAVEIVSFNDYMCGNPMYYTSPSRRNGQSKLNGDILSPVYKKDLYKGFKKRKKRKDVKFLSYIFKSDSVAFFKRFGRYGVDSYNYEYFEISLGKVPKDLNSYWAHNLVYIQDGQICHIDYFTSYCGEVIDEFQATDFIPPSAVDNCSLLPEDRYLHFTIPFERGKSEFSQEDIAPFIKSISNLSYDLDSVHIKAFSSIEGDLISNSNLQLLRAKSIAAVLKNNQDQNVQLRITTEADWDGFYSAISTQPKWRYLAKMSQTEVLTELNKIGYEELESILKNERRGEIHLYCTIQVNDHNLEYFVQKELKAIEKRREDAIKNNKPNLDILDEFHFLYECIHSKVVQGKLTPEFLAGVTLPENYNLHHSLTQNFIMYGYEFKEAFSENQSWQENHKKDEEYIRTNCSEPSHIVPEFYYILIRNAIEYYQETGNGDFDKFQSLLDKLGELQEYYLQDPVAQLNIDRLNFNLNVLLLKTVFSEEPLKYASNALKSIAQLHQFYEKYEIMNGARSIKLGKTAVHFQQINTAYQLMEPFVNEDSVLAYMLPLGYQHISSDGASAWYKEVIAMAEKMDDNIWCNMFFGNCEIPFQALDSEELRDVFCEKCMDKNELVLQLLGKE